MRISDWSSDVCSSDLVGVKAGRRGQRQDVAVLDIDHNGRSLSFGRQSPHYGFLEPKIQRRRDVSAGNGGFARKLRSEERRVGKEGVSTCRLGWSTYH